MCIVYKKSLVKFVFSISLSKNNKLLFFPLPAIQFPESLKCLIDTITTGSKNYTIAMFSYSGSLH